MAHNSDWIPLLRKVPIFASFTEKQLSIVMKAMTLASYPKGAVLVKETALGDTLYLMVSGSARLLKHNPNAKNHIDQDITLAHLSRGDAFGEMALLAGEPYTYTARVDSTADVLLLKKSDFDHLLESNPALGVHLSRILSRHLASLNRGDGTPQKPARLVSIIPGIPLTDQVLFSINLGISLTEQTRQRVLLINVDDGSNLTAKSLGLESTTITKEDISAGALQDVKKFDDFALVHPSGLEFLSIHKSVFYASIPKILGPFLTLLKDQYDYACFILNPEFDETLFSVINESDQVFFVSSPQSSPKNLEVLRRAEQALPAAKPKERIWLKTQTNGIPPNVPTGNRIPWDPNWGQNFMMTGSPFIPYHAVQTQRKIDRLARYIGQKLIGFAMGSGAAFGYALIGILRVFEREGIHPDVISGTSMGALIAGFYASGMSAAELEKIAHTITRRRLWKMANFTFPRSGILTGRGILNFIRSHLGDKTFNDLDLPFACVATDIQSGREIILDEGNVAQSIRASLSLPFFFQPYYLNGRYLVDGGLVNPVPTSIILSQGANILLSANLTSKTGDRKVPRVIGWRRRLPSILRGPTIPEILLKTIYTMQYEIAMTRSEMAHVVMDLTAQGLWWWDLDQADKIMRLGEITAEENLAKIKALLPYFSDSCKVRLTRRGRKIY